MTGLAWLAASAAAHIPILYVAGPDDDWCAVINGTIGNDVVFLLPGTYEGPCDVTADLSDVASEQTTVASFDEQDPAVFRGSSGDYVLRITGERLQLRDVQFRDVTVDAVRVGPIKELWLKRVAFSNVDGRGLVQQGAVEDLRVLDVAFRDVARPLESGGCEGCAASLVVSDTLVIGGTVGIAAGEGVTGRIDDTVLFGVDVGMVLDGTGGGLTLSGNAVDAVGEGIGILGGPVTMTSSIVAGSPAVRADTVDLADVALIGNTLDGAVVLSGWGPGRQLRFSSNAVLGELPGVGGAEADGNVGCTASCFSDPEARDYYPSADSPLRGAAMAEGEDWCGRSRGTPASAGALEAEGPLSFGPLVEDFKSETDCTLPVATDETADTGTPVPSPEETGGDTAVPESPPSLPPKECGCAGAPSGWTGLALVVLLVWRRRSRAADHRSGLSASMCGFPSGSKKVASFTMSGMSWVGPSNRTSLDSRYARADAMSLTPQTGVLPVTAGSSASPTPTVTPVTGLRSSPQRISSTR